MATLSSLQEEYDRLLEVSISCNALNILVGIQLANEQWEKHMSNAPVNDQSLLRRLFICVTEDDYHDKNDLTRRCKTLQEVITAECDEDEGEEDQRWQGWQLAMLGLRQRLVTAAASEAGKPTGRLYGMWGLLEGFQVFRSVSMILEKLVEPLEDDEDEEDQAERDERADRVNDSLDFLLYLSIEGRVFFHDWKKEITLEAGAMVGVNLSLNVFMTDARIVHKVLHLVSILAVEVPANKDAFLSIGGYDLVVIAEKVHEGNDRVRRKVADVLCIMDQVN